MITIVDYQMGNLRSVQKAIEKVGYEARVSADPREIAEADKLILPGVGGFGEAIGEIRQRDLEQPILDFLQSGRPFLGICLGLQLLFETGYEGGTHRGLGVLGGEVVRFRIDPTLKVPHMGWNRVARGADFNPGEVPTILADVTAMSHFYFVHSYFVRPADSSIVALEADYGGPFCAMIQRGPIYAAQFHPEKSQAEGLKLLKNFASLAVPASS
ncbi:imidazole glycerol phosphate synthase subunit HisH [Planctomycetaceae bacterium SH139]